MFIVETYTLCDGWINCWSRIEPGDSEFPQTFETREEAQAELDDFFADIEAEIKEGSRQPDEGYDREEYRITEITDGEPNTTPDVNDFTEEA